MPEKEKRIRTCSKCGGKIYPKTLHAHLPDCGLCQRPVAFCACGNTQRPMVNGKEWPGLKSIVTICPVAYAAEARQIASAFLANGEPPEKMLDVEVAANGATEVTHVMCERHAFPDEAQRQRTYFASRELPWVSGEQHALSGGLVDQLAMYVKEDEDTFTMLGLREL